MCNNHDSNEAVMGSMGQYWILKSIYFRIGPARKYLRILVWGVSRVPIQLYLEGFLFVILLPYCPILPQQGRRERDRRGRHHPQRKPGSDARRTAHRARTPSITPRSPTSRQGQGPRQVLLSAPWPRLPRAPCPAPPPTAYYFYTTSTLLLHDSTHTCGPRLG